MRFEDDDETQKNLSYLLPDNQIEDKYNHSNMRQLASDEIDTQFEQDQYGEPKSQGIISDGAYNSKNHD